MSALKSLVESSASTAFSAVQSVAKNKEILGDVMAVCARSGEVMTNGALVVSRQVFIIIRTQSYLNSDIYYRHIVLQGLTHWLRELFC